MINELKTDYKEDVLATGQQGKRTFNIVGENGQILFENVHIEDVSEYLQVGDEYGQDIINEQNTIINALMKGAYVRYETYDEYSDAYDNGDIPIDALVIIDELTNDNITALQVGYNNSNVKATLDSHGTSISQINASLLDNMARLSNLNLNNASDPYNFPTGTKIISVTPGVSGKYYGLPCYFSKAKIGDFTGSKTVVCGQNEGFLTFNLTSGGITVANASNANANINVKCYG